MHTVLPTSNIAYTLDQACEIVGLGKTKLYAEIKAGRLKIKKCGARSIVPRDELQRWLDNLPQSEPQVIPDYS
jgi:excisionase family DNA binding protein